MNVVQGILLVNGRPRNGVTAIYRRTTRNLRRNYETLHFNPQNDNDVGFVKSSKTIRDKYAATF